MSYLYGDSTPSALDSNVIEFLRDSLDAGVHLLLAGERMKRRTTRIAELRASAEEDVRRLEMLGRVVTTAAQGAADDDPPSPTATCAAAISMQVDEIVKRQVVEVEAHLASVIAAIEAEDALERKGCETAIGTLLGLQDPPDTTSAFRIVREGGRYRCTRRSHSTYGLDWTQDIDIASPHPFAEVTRLDKFVPELLVMAPETGGWLRKQVRNRAQRFDQLYLTELILPEQGGATLRVRTSLEDSAIGFDLEFEVEGAVRMRRVGGSNDPIETTSPAASECENLQSLLLQLRKAAGDVRRVGATLEDAKFDEIPLADLRDPAVVVERLVAKMTPIISEIAAHSQSGSELVLKRLLGDNRREEIFVSKAKLVEKLAALPDTLRAKFKPLGLASAVAKPPPLPVSATVKAASSSGPPSASADPDRKLAALSGPPSSSHVRAAPLSAALAALVIPRESAEDRRPGSVQAPASSADESVPIDLDRAVGSDVP